MKGFALVLLVVIAFSCTNSNKNTTISEDEITAVTPLLAELEYEIPAMLGEGAFWNHKTQELYWVDIEGKKLHIYTPETKTNRSFPTPSRIGTVVPQTDSTAVIALEDGIYIMTLTNGSLSRISNVESEITTNRFNDGKCDPNGNLWVGSMRMDETIPAAGLYRVSETGQTAKMLDSITISNGIVWTKDAKTMYYIDTPTGKIKAFDYNSTTSKISNERTAVVVSQDLGFPDGMAIDEEDMLWVGLWNGNAVARFNPITGELMQKIEVPAHNVTACAFGGENLDILYITTASVDMNENEKKKFPLAGSLFKVIPGVKGVENNFFASPSEAKKEEAN